MIEQQSYADKYASGSLSYSSDPYKKEESEYKKRAEHYYGMYAYGDCVFGFGGQTPTGISFKELRDHARGIQSPAKYQDILTPWHTNKKKKRTRAKWNISWRPVPYITKHRDRMKTKFEQLVLEPIVTATDEASVKAKEFIVARMKMMADPRSKQFAQKTGYPIPGAEMVKGMAPDDIDTYYEMGGIALPPEVAMKDAIDDMLFRSQWKSTRTLLFEDKIDLGAYVYHIYRTGDKLRVEYVDPARYFRRFSEYPDGRDSDFKAFIKSRKISEIRQYINDEEKIKKIAQKYKGLMGNERFGGKRSDYDRSDTSGRSGFNDDVTVEEMTLYFVDTQLELYAKGVHKRGARVFEPISPDVKFSERHQREIIQAPIQYLFKCKWIVGTDCVYDYGVADTIVREGEEGSKEVVFPIYDHISQEPSLIERCMGFDDDVQLATFKLRNLIAKLPPAPRMLINKSALKESVTFGDEEMSLRENLEGFYSDGAFFYETEDMYDLPGADEKGNRKNFIDFLPSGIVEDVNILRQEIREGLENIRQVTGSNPLEDGVAQPDLLKHTAQSMTAGTNSAIAPHIKDYVDGFERMCYIACQKWRLMVLNGDIVVGNEKKTTLTKELFYKDWNVKVLIDSADSKELLLQDLFSKKEQIPDEIFYEIYNTIQQFDIKKAQILLAKHSARAKEMEHQRVIEVQKVQAEGNAQAAIAAQEAIDKGKEKEYSLKLNFEREMAKIKEEMAQKDHKRQLELEREKAKLNFNKDVTVANIQRPVQ